MTILIAAAALFLIIFTAGYMLSMQGKPYGGVLFNLHKLIALAGLIMVGWRIVQSRISLAENRTLLTVVIIGAISALITVISGGLVSIEKPMPGFLKSVHHTFPYLTLAVSLYLIVILR